MHILALDTATKTGWARYKAPSDGAPAELASGVVEFDKDLGAFNEQFRSWLVNQAKGHGITHAFIEKPIMPMGQTQMDTLLKLYPLYTNTFGILKHKLGIPVFPVQSSTWRKHFIGNGRPKNPKKACKDMCKARGWTFKDDNEADALGILDYARAQLDPSYAANSTPLFQEVAG